ncbi:MAG: nucleotidyltransferase [Lachnospiraceae bacterium]|nr:nucleotidyltransferase [Lachnospiraceae bacterium]
MKILIPMAGEGKRFQEAGYKNSKPSILTYCIRTGKLEPMVVCAAKDLPGVVQDGSNVIFVERTFHSEDGTESKIKEFFPEAKFIKVDKLTEGQACTCLLAENYIGKDEELLIAGCDNGMVINRQKFDKERDECDVLVFTFRGDEAVNKNPNAYGWMKIDDKENIVGTSIKKSISETPLQDHAVVATFWFREGNIFIKAAEKMIQENDRVNGEFYVDKVIDHVIELGYKAKVFEIDRYIGWGTPKDYEEYQSTFEYWRNFIQEEEL